MRGLPDHRPRMTVPPALARRLPRIYRVAEVVIGIAAIAFVAYLVLRQLNPGLMGGGTSVVSLSPVHVAPPPRTIPVMNGPSILIRAGDHAERSFRVDDSRPCTLTGTVAGLSGGSRDVEVFVLDQAGYDDWHDGDDPSSIFERRAARIELALAIPSHGQFYFLISNRYSIFTDKRVEVRNVRVTCGTTASTVLP